MSLPRAPLRGCIHEQLRRVAEMQGSASAFHMWRDGSCEDITYKNLIDRAARHAALYGRHGCTRGDIVLIVLRHDPHVVYAYFGAMMAGCVPSILPCLTPKLDREHYMQSMRALLASLRPRVILSIPDVIDGLTDVMTRCAGAPVMLTPEDAGDEQPLPPAQWHAGSAGEIALLQHSSGSTGLQKGVALTHRQVMSQIASYREAIGLLESDVIISWLPLYHDMGLIACTLLPVLNGLTTIWLSPLEWIARPSMLLERIAEDRPTLIWQPNFAFSLLTRKTSEEEARTYDLSSMRSWISCSEPVSADTLRRFRDRFRRSGVTERSMSVCYAMAENVFAMTQTEMSQPPAIDGVDRRAMQRGVAELAADTGDSHSFEIVSCGRVVAGTEICALDSTGEKVPDGHVGELAIRGDSRFDGYFRDEAATATAMHGEWFRTGDLGYIRNGECFVTGRVKDLIIVAGRNISPQDIEETVNTIDGVIPGRVAAVGEYDESLGTEQVVILVETHESEPARRAELERRIRAAVAEQCDVGVGRVVMSGAGSLLKTSSGKIARKANRERLAHVMR